MNNLGFEIELEHMDEGRYCTDCNHEIFFILKGKAEITIDEETCELDRAEFLFVEANTICMLKPLEEGSFARIRFNRSVVDEIMGTRFYTIRCCSTECEIDEIVTVRNILNELLRGVLQYGNRLSFRQIGLFYQLLDEMIMHFRVQIEEISAKKVSKGDVRLAQIICYVHENYSSQISLKELTSSLYITESHLSRVIKRGLGMGFRQYVNSVRLEQAMEELRRTDKTVTRVANDCGFSSAAKFNKAFKEAFHKTPSEYRRENHENKKHDENECEKAKKIVETNTLETYLETVEPAGMKEQSRKHIQINASVAAPYTKIWDRVINIGTGPEFLNGRTQKHILFLKEELGFKYVRFWGIFLKEMMLIPEEGDYEALNFDCLDEILTFLLSNGLKPFIQLGPKPQSMMFHPMGKSFRRSESLNILNYSVNEWKQLIEKLMKHFITFFDEQEVETWIFEMWNPAPWDGAWYKWYTEEHYAETIKIVKKYAPNALMGGCEYTACAHALKLEEYMAVWKRVGVTPDYLSWSGFPYNNPEISVSKRMTEPDQLLKMVLEIRQIMAANGLGDKKLFITTWNNTISNRNALNDSLWKGAYVIKNVIDTVGQADLLGYWVASDNSSIYHDTKTILFGGAGLVSKDGIGKPAMFAFSFLKRLRKQLVQKGDNYIITRSSHGNYAIVCHNMKALNYKFYLQEEDELKSTDIDNYFADVKALKLTLHIHELLGTVYNMRSEYVNREYGSILDNWQELGGFRDIPKEDIRYLGRITVPKLLVRRAYPVDGELTLDIDLEANAFCVIELMVAET